MRRARSTWPLRCTSFSQAIMQKASSVRSVSSGFPVLRFGSWHIRRQRARSRLYQNQILQVNIRLKALAEIYTMHSFARKAAAADAVAQEDPVGILPLGPAG